VVFAPDGKTVFSVSQDRTLRQWDFLDEKGQKQLPLVSASMTGLIGSPGGHGPLLSATALPIPEKAELKKMGPTADDLYGVVFSKDGKLLATCGYAGSLTLWNLADGKPATTKLPRRLAMCLAIAPDGKAIVTGHMNEICISQIPGQ
jgi:WD40 repeat protein